MLSDALKQVVTQLIDLQHVVGCLGLSATSWSSTEADTLSAKMSIAKLLSANILGLFPR